MPCCSATSLMAIDPMSSSADEIGRRCFALMTKRNQPALPFACSGTLGQRRTAPPESPSLNVIFQVIAARAITREPLSIPDA